MRDTPSRRDSPDLGMVSFARTTGRGAYGHVRASAMVGAMASPGYTLRR